MEFKLPDIGEGVTEGEVTRWLVKPGDTLKSDQPMVEVLTDKATVELPSPVQGVVEELLVKEGTTVEVGKSLIRIAETRKEEKAPTTATINDTRPVSSPAKKVDIVDHTRVQSAIVVREREKKEEVVSFRVLATPATRKLSRDLDVDLASVKGTGPNGRVTKMDVQMAHESQQAAFPRSSHPTAPPLPVVARTALTKVKAGEVQRVPLRGIRKKISEAMSQSKRTAAHFTYVEEVDMTEIVKLKEAANNEAKDPESKLTYLPFIIKALIPALKEFPYLNSSLDDENQEIVLKGDYNIGVATDTENGLMVPVIKEADRKTTWELSDEIALLAQDARAGRLPLDKLRGSTFTVTNSGSIGGVFATPVINFPEVGILGINAIRKRPVVIDDEIKIRSMMFLSLSVDHRVVDGADAARFMNRLVYFLSDPKRFILA